MKRGLCVCLTGANAPETGTVLVKRLIALGHGGAYVDDRFACKGMVSVISCTCALPEAERLDVEVAEHDTPDFAAEKVLDELAEAGLIELDTGGYSPEEEDRIRKRLADLGYIE